MNDEASPDQPDLARFLQDWTTLWREEFLAQASDPAAMEAWRSAMALWANTMLTASMTAGSVPSPWAAPPSARDRRATPGATAAHAAPDARDVTIERLTRRVDELEARLAKLEAPRRSARRRDPG